MSVEIHRLFPEGLRHAKAEKGKLQYDTPLRFFSSKASSREDCEDSTLKTVTVRLSQKTSKEVTLYEFDGVEIFLKMQKMLKP